MIMMRIDALELAMAQGHRELAEWLRQSAEWITPLHHLGMLTPECARALLRDGAALHARTLAGGPTPLSLARAAAAHGEAPAGSTAWLVLRAAAPWSPDTHEFMPMTARARARELLGIGYALARSGSSNSSGCRVDAHALVDVWTAFVLPHARGLWNGTKVIIGQGICILVYGILGRTPMVCCPH